MKVKYYIRYVDDFIIFSKSRKELLSIKKEIETFLKEKLSLVLKPLTILKPISSGINFVGYIIKSNYLLPRNRVVNNIYKKINLFKKDSIYLENKALVYDFKNSVYFIKSINSYFGYLKPSKHKNLLKDIKTKNRFLNILFIFENHKIKNKYQTNFINLKIKAV